MSLNLGLAKFETPDEEDPIANQASARSDAKNLPGFSVSKSKNQGAFTGESEFANIKGMIEAIKQSKEYLHALQNQLLLKRQDQEQSLVNATMKTKIEIKMLTERLYAST